MIHGLSSHTASAVSALDYFLADEYFDKEQQEWKQRDPAPEILEGDPHMLRSLCDSLKFKNRYTSGVLSFTKEETDKINATPGMKEALLDELREFAYAGFKNDDSKIMGAVQHTHLGRLEIHYMIPRVSVESGLYFNPFPPNYSGKVGPGNNKEYLKQNDSFVDHVCEKYGLQNPRDPAITRQLKEPVFDTNRKNHDIRKQVVEAIDIQVDSSVIKSRDDMTRFLESHGATITRRGENFFSFKFPEMAKAIKLEGDLYGKQSFAAIAKHHGERSEAFEASRISAESRYRAAFDERAQEVEGRHSKRTEEAERAREVDPGAEHELRDTIEALQSDLDSLDSTGRDSAASAIRENPGLMNALSVASAPSSGGNGTESIADTSAGKTGNPILDELIQAYHSWKKAQLKKEAAMRAGSPLFQASQKSPGFGKALQNMMHAKGHHMDLKVSIATGYNFVEPQRGKLSNDDLRHYRQAIRDELKAAKEDLKQFERDAKSLERIQEINAPLASAERMKDAGLQTDFNAERLRSLREAWQTEAKTRSKHRTNDDMAFKK